MTDKTDSKEREAFEAWASRSIGRVWRDTTPGRTDCYQDASTNIGWRAWQARASLAASAGSEPVAAITALWEAIGYQGAHTASTGNLAPTQKLIDAMNAVEALTTHPSPPEGMVGGWMPIETAPKDGKLILVNFKSKGVRAVSWDSPFHDEVTEENGIWCVDDDKHGPYGLRGYNDDGPTAPTHWMPLPPPPTTSAGSGKGE